MPLYIRLVRLTEQGKIDMGKNPGRLSDEAGKILEKHGGRRLHTWATMGRYDFVVVVEAGETSGGVIGSSVPIVPRRSSRSRLWRVTSTPARAGS